MGFVQTAAFWIAGAMILIGVACNVYSIYDREPDRTKQKMDNVVGSVTASNKEHINSLIKTFGKEALIKKQTINGEELVEPLDSSITASPIALSDMNTLLQTIIGIQN